MASLTENGFCLKILVLQVYIDFAIPMMEDVAKGRGGKRKGKKTQTLVDIVSMIENGHDMGAEQDESGVMSLGGNSYKSKDKKKKLRVGKNGVVELGDL
jgi:hypothetical protein